MRLDTSIRMLVVSAIAMTPAVAGAQTGAPTSPLTRPWFEGSVGAVFGSHTRGPQPRPEPIALGGVVALGGRISEGFAIVAEVDGYSHGWTTRNHLQYREYVRGLMAGSRLYLPGGDRQGRIRIFGEALFGMARRDLVPLSDPVSTRRAIQAGAGLEWRLTRDRWAPSIRAAVSYRDAGDAASGLSEWRSTVTLAYRFGTLAPETPTSGGRAARAPVRPLSMPAAGRLEIAPAFTLHTPPDVNLPPRCGVLALPCGSPRTFPDLGITLSGSAQVSSVMSVAGELSAFANAWRSSRGPDGQEINHVRAALGGVRVRTPPLWIGGQKPSAMRLFAQVLAGSESSSVTTRHAAVQPGMGADFYTPVVTVRCQLDYRFVPPGERNLSAARFLVGFVFAR